MKKTIFALCMAVVVVFSTAVGLCVQVLGSPRAASVFDNALCVVLDAGHGGIDGGVVGKNTGIKESDLNLAIVYKLKTALEDMGFQVELTRKTEAGLYGTTAKGFKKRDMQRRKEIIEKADPALVISIHQNYYPARGTRGGQVFYSKEQEGSGKLAVGLQGKLNALYAKEGARARVATSGKFFMLECADCPSVIVECGFLSNADDERLLSNATWQQVLAETLAGGVMEYFSDVSA
ncbi:MAG: N-acetylmuramoyl-L-alanine amidase [Clostridiales bacterium]|nr:N-acetylmuramoyl-L-alanine amidase [Clostridiales bacterium]